MAVISKKRNENENAKNKAVKIIEISKKELKIENQKITRISADGNNEIIQRNSIKSRDYDDIDYQDEEEEKIIKKTIITKSKKSISSTTTSLQSVSTTTRVNINNKSKSVKSVDSNWFNQTVSYCYGCCYNVSNFTAYSSKNFPLYNRHEIPDDLRDPHIIQGYRYNYSFKKSLVSIFRFHNESLNTWTSMMSFTFFCLLFIRLNFFTNTFRVFDSSNNLITLGLNDKIIFSIYLLSAAYCFFTSTLFHWFGCISPKVFKHLARIDYSGISALIGASFFPPIYYAFINCSTFYTYFYLTIMALFTITCLILFSIPIGSSSSKNSSGSKNEKRDPIRIVRIVIFVSMAAFGIIPAFHIVYIYLGNFHLVQDHIINLLYTYLLYLIGVIFYSSKFPEKKFTKVFDYVLHSHQIWHIFVFLATFSHYTMCVNVFASHHQLGCGN